MRPGSFRPMSDLICLFVDQGFLIPSKPSNLYLTYLLSLKNELVSAGGRLSNDNLIPVAWTLMAMELPEGRTNPLLVKLLERLHKFERPDKPLSRQELVQLYQLSLFIKEQVSTGRLPDTFASIIPQQVVNKAA